MNIAYMTRKYAHDIRYKIEQIRSIKYKYNKKGNIGIGTKPIYFPFNLLISFNSYLDL